MLKLISYICAKPELSREAFVEYYETNHAPLVRRLLPMIDDYRRNYVNAELVPFPQPELDYDVMTELTFEDRAALDVFWATISQPEVLAAIREDESHFLLSDKTRMVGVDQYASD